MIETTIMRDPRSDESVYWHRAAAPRAALVLAHGVMSHGGWLETLGQALAARGVTAIAVDRPGSGRARGQPGANDPGAWVDKLVRVAEAAREEGAPVSLLGWCWGARPTVLAAARFGPAQLILAAPGLAIAAAVRARAEAAAAAPGHEVALPFETAAFSDDAAIVARIDADPLAWRFQPREFLAPSRAVLADALAALPSLRVPTTVLLAGDDRIIDNEGVRRLVPDARIVTLRGGHALVLESPALVADEIVRALL